MSRLSLEKSKLRQPFLVSANKTLLPCFTFFFLMIDIYFLIPAVNRKMCDSTAELAIPT